MAADGSNDPGREEESGEGDDIQKKCRFVHHVESGYAVTKFSSCHRSRCQTARK